MQKFYLSIKNTKILLVLIHLAGILGLAYPFSRDVFEFLVPFNLMATAFILLIFQKDWSKSFKIFTISVILAGFFIEMLGVQTGIIFGQYTYQRTLGFQIVGTPPIIALNWLVMVYVGGYVVHQLRVHWVLKVFLAAILLTLQDVLIEPVAIEYHFWSWKNGTPPLQNYVGWFVVAFLLEFLFFKMRFEKTNPIAGSIFYCQTVFFATHTALLAL
jgi:bisanhydrobacterioruberin hydratase